MKGLVTVTVPRCMPVLKREALDLSLLPETRISNGVIGLDDSNNLGMAKMFDI
jgi:hypothetical protein